MISNEGSTIILNFITPEAEVLGLGHGHICHMVEMLYHLKFLFCNAEHK